MCLQCGQTWVKQRWKSFAQVTFSWINRWYVQRCQKTHPNSVYLGEQFGIILLHSFHALEHGGHMRLAQQKSIIWKKDPAREREENEVNTTYTPQQSLTSISTWAVINVAHHCSIYACVPDAWAKVGAAMTACEPVSCEAANAQPCSFHQHSSSQCLAPAPGAWTEDGQRTDGKVLTQAKTFICL